MTKVEEFIRIYKNNITREGSDKLLEYLLSHESDFFKAPASTKFHGSFEGGLVEHCVNVYECLKDYLSRERSVNVYGLSYPDESIAIVSLLHDVCKINSYKISKRNIKDSSGVWQSVPYYEFKDNLPYGHGEKSVYLISNHMKLTQEEAFAIRYHMGFSGGEETKNVGDAFRLFPLALALSTADMEATFYVEK
ncbi:MAG: hydrolase [Saccharofermentanales bacterium]